MEIQKTLPESPPAVTEDEIRSEGLRLLQPKAGYRFSVDALLLAGFVRLRKKDRVLDLGTGSGVIALLLARRHPAARLAAMEIQGALADLARRNVERNGLDGQVDIVEGDLNRLREFFPPGRFDHVVTNPPYRAPHTGRLCRNSEEALARHEILTDLDQILQSAHHALRPGGRLSLIYPADRLARLMAALRAWRLEPKRLQAVHPNPEAPARLVLVEGCKDGREELTILAPLFLDRHAPDGQEAGNDGP